MANLYALGGVVLETQLHLDTLRAAIFHPHHDRSYPAHIDRIARRDHGVPRVGSHPPLGEQAGDEPPADVRNRDVNANLSRVGVSGGIDALDATRERAVRI